MRAGSNMSRFKPARQFQATLRSGTTLFLKGIRSALAHLELGVLAIDGQN